MARVLYSPEAEGLTAVIRLLLRFAEQADLVRVAAGRSKGSACDFEVETVSEHALPGVLRKALVSRLAPLALATEELGIKEFFEVLFRVIVLLLAIAKLLLRLGEGFAKL